MLVRLALVVVALGCGHAPEETVDASEATRAADILERDAQPPPRSEILALAHALEASAAKEGAGARAVSLHISAGRLFEHAWRLEHQPEDAKQADASYEAAARDPRTEGACDASVRRALLTGDVAGDATTTYVELYRASKRFSADADAGSSPTECRARVEELLASLAPFRPPPKVLDAALAALAAEGALSGPVGPPRSGPPRILRIEEWPGKEAARVVVVLDRQATFRAGDEAGAGGSRPRVFVELDGVDRGDAQGVSASGIVTRASVKPTTTGTRVDLDLDGPAYRRTFFLLEPYRVVIDIARHPPGAEPKRRAVAKIVLDPGHGGNDSGASGPSGLKEKDVTLDIARRVAPVLGRDGMQVVLTRDDDRTVTLEERTARANQVAADLFVSIHCNAAENRARHGVETYVLDTTSDVVASRIAARENATSESAGAELGSILASMKIADQASHSNHLAELLQKSAMASLKPSYADALDGGVHPAGFYVLVGARMPAVLFETSYISHPVEESRLASEEYKARLVDAIVNAVRAYRDGR